MIQAIKLENFKTLSDLKMDQYYIATYSSGWLHLNNQIKAKSRSELAENKTVPVKIIKIKFPFELDVAVIDEPYEISNKEKKEIIDLKKEDIGHEFTFYCTIEDINQTSGPTIFTLFDGTGAIKATGFIKPGERAFPGFNQGDAVKAIVKIAERDNDLECAILKLEKLLENKERQLKNKIVNRMELKSTPERISFLVKNDILEKLRPRIIIFAKEIRKAIFESRPIILRHHADCDGYCAAIALERAILPLIAEQHKNSRALRTYYRRAPSKAPFYELSDATKDLVFTLDDAEKFGTKHPLVILADNGSTEEDLIGIRKIKIYNARVIVVDHHFPGEPVVDKYLEAHVNPYLEGGDSNLTAGMLGVEISRYVNKNAANVDFLAALSGVGDRAQGEHFQQYIQIALEKGITKEYLLKLAEVVDFEAYYLRFLESRGLVDDLLGQDIKKQEKLVSLLYEDVQRRKKTQKDIAMHYLIKEEINNLLFVTINLSEIMFSSEFPPPGKTVGMVHDNFLDRNTITAGIDQDFITIRSNYLKFNIHDLISMLSDSIPYGGINGGGHKVAGTIKFIPKVKELVIKGIKEYLKTI